MHSKYWFQSDLFKIQAGEDEETNPACYGKDLGNWLCLKFKDFGYKVEELIAEDWGWCVMCERGNYLLWVGCGSILTETTIESLDPAITPDNSEIV